ncbi:hypothetical protein [Mariniluteicoccus flavus]
MTTTTSPNRDRTWAAVAVFVLATALATAPLWWLQTRLDIAWWVFSLPSAAPAFGALVTLALRRPLGLAAVWLPGFGFNIQVVRRCILLLALGAGIVLGCVQFATMLRWPKRPIVLEQVPYPFSLPGDLSTMLLLLGLGFFLMAGLEELGWRSLLQPTLRRTHGVLVTGLVTGLLWGLMQPELYVRALERWRLRPVMTEVGMFVIAHVAAAVALSWLIALGQQRMKHGQWLSAVAIRWVLSMGFFLWFDEELGRWQPMVVIAFVMTCFAAVGLYYHWRGLRARAVRAAGGQPATAR